MKTIISKYILPYFFIGYFLVAGMGYNVVNYCCQMCSDIGLESVVTESCHVSHASQAVERHACHCDDKENATCTAEADVEALTNISPNSKCTFLRVNLDAFSIDSDNFDGIRTYHHFGVDLFLPAHIFAVNSLLSTCSSNSSPPKYICANGRKILSLKSVLII